MKLDKRLLVAIFAAAAAVTFVLTGRRGNENAAAEAMAKDAEEKRRKRKKALNLTMRVQIQNLINTQKMIEAVIGAVREYIRIKKSKGQVKGTTANALPSSLQTPVLTSNVTPAVPTTQTISYDAHVETSNESKRLKPWERKRQNAVSQSSLPSSSSPSTFIGGNTFYGYQPMTSSSSFASPFSTSEVQQNQQQQPQIQPQAPGIVTSHV